MEKRRHRSVTPERAAAIGRKRVSVYAKRSQVDAIERLAVHWNVTRNDAAGRAWALAERAVKAGFTE